MNWYGILSPLWLVVLAPGRLPEQADGSATGGAVADSVDAP